jgi:hypothetical protein
MIALRVWRLSWGQMWKTRAQIGLVEWSSGDGVVGVVVAWYLVHVERCVVRSARRNMWVQLVQHECQPMENRLVGGIMVDRVGILFFSSDSLHRYTLDTRVRKFLSLPVRGAAQPTNNSTETDDGVRRRLRRQ